MSKRYKIIIQLIGLILFAISTALTLQYYQQILPSGLNYNYCSIKNSCESIFESQFSSYFSLPVSLFALLYVLKIFALVSLDLNRGFFISIISGIVSFIYLFILFFVEKSFCHLCLSFHIFNIIFTILIARGVKTKNSFDVKYLIVIGILFVSISFLIKEGLNELISRIEVSDQIEVIESNQKKEELLEFQKLLNITNEDSKIVFYLDPTCKFCREHMENFLAFNRLKKMKIMIVPYIPNTSCEDITSDDSSFAACEAVRYTYCLTQKDRTNFFLSILSDQIWKYAKPDDLQAALKTYYPNKNFDFNLCKKNYFTEAQMKAETFNMDNLPSATPLIYYNNSYYLGQLEIKEFWSIFTQEE